MYVSQFWRVLQDSSGRAVPSTISGSAAKTAQLSDEKHQHAPEAGFLKERPDIEPVLLARKQRASFESFIARLRERAKIRQLLDQS